MKRKILKMLLNIIACNIFYLVRIFPIKRNKIVFSNLFGKGYGDNPKYIAEEIINQNLNCDMVWLVNRNWKGNFPKKIRIVKCRSLRAIFELATAKIWVDNCRKSVYIRKRKSQYYIQTWHGSLALKRIEKDVEDKLSLEYVKMAKNDSKMIDLMISNSKFCTDMYRRCFWYDGEILEVGSPRCDVLFKMNNIREKVCRYFSIPIYTKIVLYAPTFRVDSSIEVYKLDFHRLIKALEKKNKEKYVCLVRLHPNILQKSEYIEYGDKIINSSFYDDMQELLIASDILITDYSSTMFEFALTNKPVFLYAPDIDDYRKDRDFYFNIKELPFVLAENNDELEDKLNDFKLNVYKGNLNVFMNQFNLMEEGNASFKVVEKIKQIIQN